MWYWVWKTNIKNMNPNYNLTIIPAVLFNYDGIKDNVPMLTFLGELTNHQDKAKSVIATYESNIQKVKDAIKNQQPARIAVLRATGKGVTAETDEDGNCIYGQRIRYDKCCNISPRWYN